ncbi:site-specific integrase [Pseudomonas moorei]|uniref:site-specific integrase n=1 Tax=Pseudomonas moorei TaxID=395599 RepID=UPI00200EBAF9|nr:site-specific integrase [Pseudomonas moorei]
MSRLEGVSISRRSLELEFKVVKFTRERLGRCMLLHAKTHVPCISASVYEAAYALGNRKHKASIQTIFYHLAFLFTWASIYKVDVEHMLLSGVGIDFVNIKKFSVWLEKTVSAPVEGSQVNRYVSKVLHSCSSFSIWFVQNYTPLVSTDLGSNVSYIELLKSHKKCWSCMMVGGKPDPVAPDLTDNELEQIDFFMKRRLDSADHCYGLHLRNYILWRLVARFGIRIGEALALRLEDVDLTGADPSLQIVRIDERGADYRDPRTPNNPRVKTYGRLLYFGSGDEDLIEFIEEYVSIYRVAKKKVGAGVTIFIDHDFLFVSHGAATLGDALSCSTASKVARTISRSCVPRFHWHILRHAVFNRLYEAASKLESNATEIDHIVYMGGWGSPESLKLYAKRATRDMSRGRLIKRNEEVVKRGN